MSVLFGSIFFGFVAVTAVAVALNGCNYPSFPTGGSAVGDAGGYEDVVLDLPFAEGYQTLCTQGANGSYSHQSSSTEADLDLDTPNGEDDLVYAPIGGTARVHRESASRNFGYHVNIDRGNGSYVVVAHLDDIFVADGEEVAAGQMIGYEGCTGNCSGDHVHVGLHQGSATSMAEFGRSQSVSFFVDDATTGDEGQTLTSSDFICGTTAGHRYESNLSVPKAHPDGSLVKTPDNANVYLIEDGTRRWIETEEVFWSLGYDFQNVALISPDELACYDVGEAIDTADAPPTEYASADGAVVLREGDLVKEESQSDVYVVSGGVAMPIESYDVLLKLGWGSRWIQTIVDGKLVEIISRVGNCAADSYCVDEAFISACATDTATDRSDEGGAEDTSEEEVEEEVESDAEYEDLSSMLEGEIDDGEFGFAFLPPEGFDAIESLLIGSIVTDDGNVLADGRLLTMNTEGGEIVYTTSSYPNGGVNFYFVVQASEEMAYHYACELDDDLEPEQWGSAYAQFGADELPVALSTEYDTGIGCALKVHIPVIDPGLVDADEDGFVADDDCDDLDAEVNPSKVELCDDKDNDCDGRVDEGTACPEPEDTAEVVDTGSGEEEEEVLEDTGEDIVATDSGATDTALEDTAADSASIGEEEASETDSGSSTSSAVSDVEICYFPGDTIVAGELYLDGGFFTAWDTAPAASGGYGDTEMCATERVATGESIKMNAWYIGISSGTVEWAAYNNVCLSIDWQGSLTVDGVSTTVTTAPWSAASWAVDPCLTGGDAYFDVL